MKTESFPFKIRIIQEHSLSHSYSINSIESPIKVISHKKDKKGFQIRKEEIKLSLFADDMMLCMENTRDSIKTVKTNNPTQ